MSLTRFGNFAVDWNRVYAVRILERLFDLSAPGKVAVLADLPGVEAGKPVGIAEATAAIEAWKHAETDKRFSKFMCETPMAIDMSRVTAVAKSPESKSGVICFDFGNGRGLTMTLDGAVADVVLFAADSPTENRG